MPGTMTANEVKNCSKVLDRATGNRMFARTHREYLATKPFVIDVTCITGRGDRQSKST
jgi:hypothetical protein